MPQSGQQAQQFQGTPLFVAKGGEDQGYLTIQQNGQQVIPFFFEKEQLQGLVDRFKQQQPNMASTVKVEAVTLEGVIQTLQSSNNEQLNNIVLVPSRESLEYIRGLSSSQGSQQAPAAPQRAPQRPQ
jgi:nickel transport protein